MPCALPEELGTDLPDARIAGARDHSEAATVDVAAWILELRVIENVEEFDPNLEGHVFGYGGSLHEPKISIVEARAVEEPAVRGPESPESGVGGKCARQKVASRA
jgi:hypothetical protein